MGIELYVGLDESNHSGLNEKKGEIITASSSLIHDDSIVRIQSHRRDYESVKKLMQNPDRDYLFTILTGEKYSHRDSSYNLLEAAPLLITSFPFFKGGYITKVKIYFDGRLPKKSREILKSFFSPLDVVVDNFQKSKGKPWECPSVIYMSDVIANTLYNLPVGEALKHPKFVPYKK